MVDSMLAFDNDHVVVDADQFERAAYDALRRREIDALESALAAYAGEVLPEDRYADWCAERRAFLADLRVRLLLDLADLRLLIDAAHDHPLLLVLGDLGEVDRYSLDMIGYLAHLAVDRRWLLVGAVREEQLEPGTAIARLLATAMREGLCRKVERSLLTRSSVPAPARTRSAARSARGSRCGARAEPRKAYAES
jgi:hypothetical protein